MTKADSIMFSGVKMTIADLVAQLSALAANNKLRHNVSTVTSVYTLYADYPYNTRVIVIIKLHTAGGISIVELKNLETLTEFVSGLEVKV